MTCNFFTEIDISACQIWLKLKFCPFEIVEKPSSPICDSLKCAIFKHFGGHFLAGKFKYSWSLKKIHLYRFWRLLSMPVRVFPRGRWTKRLFEVSSSWLESKCNESQASATTTAEVKRLILNFTVSRGWKSQGQWWSTYLQWSNYKHSTKIKISYVVEISDIVKC